MPVDTDADRVIDCPTSIFGEDGLVPLATRAELTVTVATLEVSGTGTPELSVTRNSNDQVPTVAKVSAEVVGVSPTLQENDPPRAL